MNEELLSILSEFKKLELHKVLNFDEFNRIAIVHHGSAIEGSTLTYEETALLIREGITAKGKPMLHHQMVTDHYTALKFVLEEAEKKTEIVPEFLRKINALVNRNTGQVRNTALGVCDDTAGDFRLGNVTAGSTYFVNYDKVIPLVNQLCDDIRGKMKSVKTSEEIYSLSFDVHFYLVSIHPWFDGNGRTSRLLMNFIQNYFHQPLSLVFAEDKPAYIEALTQSRTENTTLAFRSFMFSQLTKFLRKEIDNYNNRNKGLQFVF